LIVICKNCKKEFIPKNRSLHNKFCSRKCANVYHNLDEEVQKKRSQSLKKTYKVMTKKQKEERSLSISEGYASMSSEKKLCRSQAMKDDWKNKTPEERVSKLSGLKANCRNSLGKIPWNKGLTKETDPRVAQYAESGAKTRKERPLTEKQIQANRVRKLGKTASPEAKENYRKAAQKRNREDMNYWKNLRKALNLSPNKQEQKLDRILQSILPGEYKYVGDFSLIIGGKCPDFFNVNGQKKLIELYGNYWHRNDDPQDRISFFTPFGFQTLIVWESELQNKPKLVRKLKHFNCIESKKGSLEE